MALSTTVVPCNNAELMSSGPNWPTIRGYGLIDIVSCPPTSDAACSPLARAVRRADTLTTALPAD